MTGYKDVLGIVTLLIAVVSYSFYFKDVFLGHTRPQPFSWFVWSVLSAVAFAGQIASTAGPGAWITGFTAVVCLIISVIASFKGATQFKILDWISLFAALAALLLWYCTRQPVLAEMLVSAAYALGFIPTIVKSYNKPQEETATTFGLNSIKFGISIFSLTVFSVATWLYPLTLFVLNGLFAIMLLARRQQTAG